VAQYVIVWEFRAAANKEAEFIEKYGPDGIWARFFRKGQGYVKTELVRDVADRLRFLTLDYWASEEEFKRFREQNHAEYERLDKECKRLTETESCLGILIEQTEISKAKS
jgi:heme-degrading monooxygenase HmoA